MMTFERWMQKVDELGIRERIFDKPDLVLLCPMQKTRRLYTGKDGIFYELFVSGCPPEFAIGEALAAD